MIFDRLFRFSEWLSRGLAIDLGTANTLIFVKGRGIVLDEPSLVALEDGAHRVLGVGRQARAMFGRTNEEVHTIRPMKDGVIADFDVTKIMIQHFIRQVYDRRGFIKPVMIVCVPSGITQVEMKAVIDSALQSGARKVHLVEEPMAAAIGSKLPIHQNTGSMVVDIGGGTTEVAVISNYAIAYSESIRVAGDEMDEAIQRHLQTRYGLAVGTFEAERIKIEVGSAHPLSRRLRTEVRGLDIPKGVPTAVEVTDEMIREAMDGPVNAIVAAIKKALSRSSPELAGDITRRGIVLAGGGSLLKGLGARLHSETGLPIYRAKDPLTAIVRGTGEVLENFPDLKKVCVG